MSRHILFPPTGAHLLCLSLTLLFALLLCGASVLAHEPDPKKTPPSQATGPATSQGPAPAPRGAMPPGHVHPPGEAAPHVHPPAAEGAPREASSPGYVHASDEGMPHPHSADAETPAPHRHAEGAGGPVPPHEHSAITPNPSVVRGLLLVTLALATALILVARRSLQRNASLQRLPGNLLAWPVIGGLLRWRYFPTLLIAPTMAVFLFIVLAGFWGEQNTGNPAVLLTWILWWPAVIFTFLLLGRIWCTACPFGYVGDLAQKIFSFGMRPPRVFKNMWWRLGLFLALTWATTLWALDRSPRGTALLGLAITFGAVALAVLYEKRTFCRYVCPLGGIFGLYAMSAPVRLAVGDKQVCQQECPGKDCYRACAWFDFPSALDRNAECNLCLDCVRACPHDNLLLRTQAPAADLAEFQPHRKSLDEAATVAAVLGVALLQTLVMLDAWSGWQERVGSLAHIAPGPVLYTLLFLTFGLAIPAAVVALVSFVGLPPGERRQGVFHAFRTYAYAFLPLGLGLHAAHNFHHLFGEGAALWAGLKQAAAHYGGWIAPEAADAATSLGPNTLYFLQWLALAGGLYLASRVAVGVARRNTTASAASFRAVLPVLLFAVAYTVLNLIILSAPMAHRH